MKHVSQAEAMPSYPSAAVQRVFRNGSVTIVWLSGEHDAGTAQELRRILIGTVVADLNDVVIDLTGVTFMDAAALGALMSTRNILRKQDRFLTVRGSPRCVVRLFEICEVTSFFVN